MVRLSLILPEALFLSVPPGRHLPCLAGCVLTVHRLGLVAIEAPDEMLARAQLERFLRLHGRGHAPLAVVCLLADAERESSLTARLAADGKVGWSAAGDGQFTPNDAALER